MKKSVKYVKLPEILEKLAQEVAQISLSQCECDYHKGLRDGLNAAATRIRSVVGVL